MINDLVDYWPVLLLGVGAALLLVRRQRTWSTDSRFGVRRVGGRSGTISVSMPTFVARVDFEIGAGVDLIVFPQSFRDAHDRPLEKHQQHEAVARLWSWASARDLAVDIPGFAPPPEALRMSALKPSADR